MLVMLQSLFNLLKSKLVCYKIKNVKDVSIQLFGQFDNVLVIILAIIDGRKTLLKWCDIYCRSNSILKILTCQNAGMLKTPYYFFRININLRF